MALSLGPHEATGIRGLGARGNVQFCLSVRRWHQRLERRESHFHGTCWRLSPCSRLRFSGWAQPRPGTSIPPLATLHFRRPGRTQRAGLASVGPGWSSWCRWQAQAGPRCGWRWPAAPSEGRLGPPRKPQQGHSTTNLSSWPGGRGPQCPSIENKAI
jgi:hypothetical protein